MRLLSALVAASLAAAFSLCAQPAEAGASGYSLTPFAGYRIGGRFDDPQNDGRLDVDESAALGLIASMAQAPGRHYELLYSRQSTDLGDGSAGLGIEYLHLGGRLDFPQGGFSTLVTGGIGATRVSARRVAQGSDLRPSMSLGMGLEIPLAEGWAIRLEARGYLTFTGGDRTIFCQAGGEGSTCLIQYRGGSLLQFDALAGLSFSF